MARRASSIPSFQPPASSAAHSAAPALASTISRRGLRSPCRTAVVIAAFSSGRPPAIASGEVLGSPRSSGAIAYVRTLPFRNSETRVDPTVETSSTPSSPWTTRARRAPISPSTWAMISVSAGS